MQLQPGLLHLALYKHNNKNYIPKVLRVPNARGEEVRHEELKQLSQGCIKNIVNFTGPKHKLNTLIVTAENI